MIEINIARDYTKTPGGRFIKEGPFSGEDFRKRILIPKYEEAEATGECLRIILDGGYGYGSSFLEEAFGGLVREGYNLRPDQIIIISNEEPKLVEDINSYIINAIKAKG